jgi:hypothetical protein
MEITGFCNCTTCKILGYHEPLFVLQDSDLIRRISSDEAQNGYSSFYKIGNNIFKENLHRDRIYDDLKMIIKDGEKCHKNALRLMTMLDLCE